jgi:REP element-mobilizing transposase RayT
MGYPRKALICLTDTPYYHVVARCVRRAWLWGFDAYAGKDYSHRKAWVLQRLEHLSNTFAIDLCAYAVMSNHYHLVLRVDRTRAAAWSQQQIIERWGKLFRLPTLITRWQEGTAGAAERDAAEQEIACWRARLSDISWYMRCLNEHLARRANAEDECTGRFWEGRFKSQALLGEVGLLTAMAYVDLNPVRAGIATTPEESEFTSIHARLRRLKTDHRSPARRRSESSRAEAVTPALISFRDAGSNHRPTLPMRFPDYLQVLDWTARQARPDKNHAINRRLPPILTRLSIDPSAWGYLMQPMGNLFGRAMGRLDQLRSHAERLGQSWIKGLGQAERLYRTATP